ncbi:phage head-tail connector protein [Ezakiella coagulans]|uniref:phage head-tail connector protein n=1 Tax=Ezakiella coagulans TaxID=46507 RepID=UPI00288B3FBD|nr:DNA-packaging protein [Ezakiella coagulans]
MTPELLKHCKILLRQATTTAFDEEIETLIEACLLDLKLSGVEKTDDELVKRAVGIYVKAHFGSENPDRDGLIECYNSLKTHLALSEKYGDELPHEKAGRN